MVIIKFAFCAGPTIAVPVGGHTL